MRKSATIVAAIFFSIALILTIEGCGSSGVSEMPVKEVTVGSKNFTEEYIIGQLMKQLLEARGFKVKLISDLTSMAIREAMEDGSIDICADYTGTVWMVYLDREYRPGIDNNELYHLVKVEERAKGFIWLDPMWNNNTYVLASWPEFAEVNGLTTLSDLAALYREKEGKIKTFVGFEFSIRPDGLPALQRHYDFVIDEGSIITGTVGTSLVGLENRECDVAMVFGTDAAVTKNGWHVYTDDKFFFPPYDLTPYVREEVLDKYPEIETILNELIATFPGGGRYATPEIISQGQKVWQELNAMVDIEKMNPEEAAREYLVKHGLIE